MNKVSLFTTVALSAVLMTACSRDGLKKLEVTPAAKIAHNAFAKNLQTGGWATECKDGKKEMLTFRNDGSVNTSEASCIKSEKSSPDTVESDVWASKSNNTYAIENVKGNFATLKVYSRDGLDAHPVNVLAEELNVKIDGDYLHIMGERHTGPYVKESFTRQ